MISILYNTIRPGGIDILKNTLDKQTHRDFELVFVDGWTDGRGGRRKEVLEYLNGYKVVYLEGLPKKDDDVWTLNKDYNRGLAYCSGDIVVFLQDYLWIPRDGIEKLLDVHKQYDNAFVTSHGEKAMYPNTMDNPNGKLSIWIDQEPGKPTGVSEKDGREVKGNGISKIEYNEWEMNFASAPLSTLRRIGFFDEDMDRYFSGDNVVVAAKALMSGANFYMNKDLKIIGYNQDAFFPRHPMWDEWHSNKGYLQEKTWKILNQEYSK